MNTANHIPQEDLALIALQLLSEQEMNEALLHLEHCEACRLELARFQGDLAVYAMTSEMHSPPAQARERLMRRVAKEKKIVPIERPVEHPVERSLPVDRLHPVSSAPSVSADEPWLTSRSRGMFAASYEAYEEPRRGRVSSIAAWAGWAIAAGVAVVAGMQFHQRQELQATLNDMTARAAQSNAEIIKAEETLQTLTSQGAMQVTMRIPPPEGVPASHLPEGHAAYDPNKGTLVFIASNLLPVPSEKTYELWVLPQADGAAPIPAGTFRPDMNGNASVVMPNIPKGVPAKGFGVTIEDAGGAKTPTMPIVLVGL